MNMTQLRIRLLFIAIAVFACGACAVTDTGGKDGEHGKFDLQDVSAGDFHDASCIKNIKAMSKRLCDKKDAVIKKIKDVDGDGARESLITCKSTCGSTGNCTYRLYLSNHRCSRFAGSLVGAMIEVTRTDHNGLKDLSTYRQYGCGGAEGSYSEFHYDGREYKLGRQVECTCEDAADRPPECPPASR